MQFMPQYGLGYPNNIQSGTTGYSGISEVSSLDEVKAASVPFGVHIYMSNSSNTFYAKNTQGVIKAFKFEEMPMPSNNPENFVTREEFDDLRRQYEQLAQQHATSATAKPIPQWTGQPIANVATAQYDTTTSATGVMQQDSSNGMDQGTGEPIP